jgi:ArsR family metal-binding transcriptional regulator
MSRFLRVELSLPREERMNCAELLKMVRNDWERLTEISPLIPENLIDMFRELYKKRNVSKPDEIHGIDPIRIFNTLPKKTLRDIL